MLELNKKELFIVAGCGVECRCTPAYSSDLVFKISPAACERICCKVGPGYDLIHKNEDGETTEIDSHVCNNVKKGSIFTLGFGISAFGISV